MENYHCFIIILWLQVVFIIWNEQDKRYQILLRHDQFVFYSHHIIAFTGTLKNKRIFLLCVHRKIMQYISLDILWLLSFPLLWVMNHWIMTSLRQKIITVSVFHWYLNSFARLMILILWEIECYFNPRNSYWIFEPVSHR